MKKTLLTASIFVFAICLQAQPKKNNAKKPTAKTSTAASSATAYVLKTTNDSLSYAFGISLAQYMKSQGITNINNNMLLKAISHTLKDEKPLLDMNAANALMGRLAENKSKAACAVEKEKGDKFLEENKKRPGIKVTVSGLQYEVIKEGTGAIPTREDTVVAHYAGSLIEGKEFDNSYKRGEPLTIPVGGVIPGWTEALTLMPVGSKWKLYIPSGLGYGDYGAGQDIPGGATLIFDVELLAIKSKK